jgi:hypothetical protein
VLGLVLRQDRHEGLGESAFGKDAPQQVGQLEGDDEGVRCHAGTEDARNERVANETQHTGNHGQGADGGQGLEQIHEVSTIRKAGTGSRRMKARSVTSHRWSDQPIKTLTHLTGARRIGMIRGLICCYPPSFRGA